MINKTLKKHHVYMYRSPVDGVPVYVGKGWGDRAWQHLEIAARNPEQHSNKRFARTLAKWLREGYRIEPSIVQVFESHEAALDHEVELIRLYGRSDIKTGTLFNLTDGGEGTAGRGLQVEVEGVNYPTYREACLVYGLEPITVRNRISYLGYTIRQAFGVDPAPVYPPTFTKPISVGGIEFPTIKEACVHFSVSYQTVTARINRTTWTTEQIFELEEPPPVHGPNAVSITVGDHEFPSLEYACKILVPHLKPNTVQSRIKVKGWTIEQAFGIEPPPSNKGGVRKAVTAFGKTYSCLLDAATSFGIDPSTVAWRLKHGRTIEDALTEKIAEPYTVGDLTFKHFTAACEYFGQGRSVVSGRLKLGWSKEDAFRTKIQKKDYVAFGRKFGSIREAAEFHGLKAAAVAKILSKGKTLEQALTTKEPAAYSVGGLTFENFTSACKHFDVSRQVVAQRLKKGMSKEDAFVPVKRKPNTHESLDGNG